MLARRKLVSVRCLLFARQQPLLSARNFSTGPFAASVLVKDETEGKIAAARAVADLSEKLVCKEEPSFTLWFAKGYGARATEIEAILQERFGKNGVVMGSSAEAGVIGDGCEVQEATFALSVLTMRTPGVRVFPFYSEHMESLPELSRGGSWSEFKQSPARPSILAFCALPVARGVSPQKWCTMIDDAVYNADEQSLAKRLPTIIGGLTVGHHIFIDGAHHMGGAFGVSFLPDSAGGASLDALVCQGAVPFGPTMKITGVSDGYIITEIDGQNPKEVLEPLLNGPLVPGTGQAMAGIFDFTGQETSDDPLASTNMSGRPNCVMRQIHGWTPPGHLVVAPIMDDIPYASGMKIQMHCMNKDLAIEDLRMRAGFDFMANSGSPPDAAVIISCGARGVSLYEKEGVESNVLRQAWGCDVPTTGFFAGGEIGPVGDKTFMHGYTTSCLFMRFPAA